MEWISVKDQYPPKDGTNFLACIRGEWVGEAVSSRHYSSPKGEPPKKDEFFYITENPEYEGWEIQIDAEPFPITHWMPMPKPPK